MRERWDSYQTLQAMADREATRFQAARRFISSYIQTLELNTDPFVDQLADRPTIARLVAEFPGIPYEEPGQVPPLESFLALRAPPPFPTLMKPPTAPVPQDPPLSPSSGQELLRQSAQQLGTLPQLPGARGSPFQLRPAFQTPPKPAARPPSTSPTPPPAS
ncbi:hypothetical protein H1R20_g9882, partial [Candolleomyces eurysporus]